jgi:pilus assembly protein CpaE
LGADTRTALEQAVSDRRLAKARPKFLDGGIPAAIVQYQAEPSPALLIVETHDAPAKIFDELDRLAEVCQGGTNLIVLGQHNDVMLYRQLTRRGVREYIPLPVEPTHLTESIAAIATDPQDANLGRLIAFIGASGGAGSSTVSNNLAWCLGKQFDSEVTLVDLDFVFGTVALDFNMESEQSSASALAQADRLDDVLLDRFLAKYNDNLALLTAPGDAQAAGEVDNASLERLLTILRRNASWVLLDLPHFWGGWVRHVLDTADEIVVTAVPTLTSLRNTKSLCDALNAKRRNDAPVRVVLNRIGGHPKTDLPLKDFVNALGSPPTITLPHDPGIFAAAANAGRMLGETQKSQRVMEPLNQIAALVSGRERIEKRRRAGLPGVFRRLIGAPA